LRIDIDEVDALLDRPRYRNRLVTARLGRDRRCREERCSAENQYKLFHNLSAARAALPRVNAMIKPIAGARVARA
jgi:hypothetical protein